MEIDIDIDGELPVEMVQAILWEQHRGAEFTGEPWYLQPQNPASPPTEDEPFGINSGEPKQALYQVLHAEMQQELDSDRRFFLENPRRVHMVRPAFPVETQLLREQAYILEGTDPMLDGKMVIAIKQLAPGLRLRQQVPPNMAQGLFATLDEDQTRRMWESCIGA